MIMAQRPARQADAKQQRAHNESDSSDCISCSIPVPAASGDHKPPNKETNETTGDQNYAPFREKTNNFVSNISTNVDESQAPTALRTSPSSSGDQNLFKLPNSNAAATMKDADSIREVASREANSNNRPQSQDSKRTLIKNQLYLIEQLQLENADLRNERDQLQLENEELKFQLQMISSSNILGQPGNNAFDDRRAEKLVETNGEIVETAAARADDGVTAVTTNNLAQLQRHQQKQKQQLQGNSGGAQCTPPALSSNHVIPTTQPCYYESTALTKISASDNSARPLQTIQRSMNCCNASNIAFGEFSEELSAHSRGRLLSNGNNNFREAVSRARSETNSRKKFGETGYPASKVTTSAAATPAQQSNKFLRAKSSSLTAFNVKSNIVPRSTVSRNARCDVTSHLVEVDCNDYDHDESNRRVVKLVEQNYGGDSVRIQAAAIIIQRAFRKYQICKRFRMITEQLRHACQSSSPVRKPQHNASVIERNAVNHRSYESSSKQSIGQAENSSSSTAPIPFASGATRAATWESLSQAASRLAASAASATILKQSITDGVAVLKSVPYQQEVATYEQSNPTKTTALSSFMANNSERSPIRLKSDSVVAAAINFQQLESIRKRQYRVGLNIFNKSPGKGISFLIAHSFIDSSPAYMKSSTSYYLSNQLHFIDKQHLAATNQQPSQLQANVKSKTKPRISQDSLQLQPNCRFCYEEENLKRNVAHFLLHRKGLAREMIGQYLGNLQSHFVQDVLVYYLQELDFYGMQIDVALRKFSSTLRMPGEAQKIERFVDRFACRYVQCQQVTQTSNVHQNYLSNLISDSTLHNTENGRILSYDSNDGQTTVGNLERNNLTQMTKDDIFILTFAIIMLNTDLHSPQLKSTSRMSANQFVNNLRGVFKSQTIKENDLIEIYERVKSNQITTTPDHVTHVMKVQQGLTTNNFQKKELPNLCVPHRRLVCFCRLFEVYDISKKERLGQHQREIFLFNDILLVTKLARRARANTPQQYTFRHSVQLQGLYVQLFQSAHYNFGIKLCRCSNDETLIMFNARNELDQSRFVDDLNESIAEMDEMDLIKSHNIVETVHFKQLERLKRHAMMHETDPVENKTTKSSQIEVATEERVTIMESCEDDQESNASANVTVVAKGSRQLPCKFNSMSNLASVVETTNEIVETNTPRESQIIDLRLNRSYTQKNPRQQACYVSQKCVRNTNQVSGGVPRSCSTNSVHSLDSGLFLSRDVSPNQSG